jgi:hypothetical protein
MVGGHFGSFEMRKKLFVLAALLLPQAGLAQVEVTVQVGYRSGGIQEPTDIVCIAEVTTPCPTSVKSDNGSLLGVTLGFPVAGDWALEVHASRQEEDLVLFYPGLNTLLPAGEFELTVLEGDLVRRFDLGNWQPFAGAGLGVARLETFPEPVFDLDQDRLSANLVAGVNYRFSDHFGIRLEGRARWISLPEDIEGEELSVESSAGISFRL